MRALLWLPPVALAAIHAALAATAAAPEAPALLHPTAIVLHLDAGVTDRRFLPELTWRLTETLTPPVSSRPAALDLDALRSAGSPLDGLAVSDAFIGSIDWAREAQTVQVLLIGDDIRLRPARYNFAVSNGTAATPWHVVIVSLARLRSPGLLDAADQDPQLTAVRVFKLVAKNVAKVSGYGGSTLCLFGFPRSLPELDAMPEGYCEPDLSLLVGAGIARSPPAAAP
jgi:hypothetical protein